MELFLYLDRRTFLHRLDPRVKIICLLLLFALALVFNHPLYLLCLLALVLCLGWLGRSLTNIAKIRVLLTLLFLFSSVLWPLFLRTGEPLFKFGFVSPSRRSLLYGLAMGLRLDVMVISGVVFLSTTMVEEFTWGLRKFGLPYPVGFALSMSFRLVPTLVGTGATVAQAQRSRGLDLDLGNIFARVRKHVPLLIPIFFSTVRSTDSLAMALEAKGFGAGRSRVSYLDFRMKFRDYFSVLSFAVLFLVCFYLRLRGIGVILPRI